LVERVAAFLLATLAKTFLSLGSNLSIASLLSALWIAIAFLLVSRRPGKKNITHKVMRRALFPRWFHLPSFRADVVLLLLNLFAFGVLFGWTVVSSGFISNGVAAALSRAFGPARDLGLDGRVGRSIMTVSLFLTYELAYWFDHYLSHRVPVLWEFHKVHHTAEVLSPITNLRVHPVDSIVFYNILGAFLGTTGGVLKYMHFGNPFVVGGTNAILVAFIFLTVHLQHSHVWIPITGPLGRVILSPAHHQIHHSDNPIHFDKNFGGCLALWDWVFGTLHMPERRRERLRFGIQERTRKHHTIVGCLITPFVRASGRLTFVGGAGRAPVAQVTSPATFATADALGDVTSDQTVRN
jgi:sterol desaturase/sphingolipid hydroxylase (fatty acid hydroxylase superfamily)